MDNHSELLKGHEYQTQTHACAHTCAHQHIHARFGSGPSLLCPLLSIALHSISTIMFSFCLQVFPLPSSYITASSAVPSRFLSSSSLHIPPSLFSLPPASKDAISVAELEGTCLTRWNNITHPRPLMSDRVFLDQNMHSTGKVRTFSRNQDVFAVPYKCEGLFECYLVLGLG